MVITLLKTSFVISATILGLTILAGILKRPVLARLRYICWIAVVLGLLIPVRFPVINFKQPVAFTQIEDLVSESVALPSAGKAALILGDNEWDAFKNARNQAMLDTARSNDSAVTSVTKQIRLETLILILWAAGCAVFLMLCTIRHILFMKYVKRWGCFAEGGKPFNTLEVVRSKIRLKRKVSLYICSALDTSVMTGFFKPMIILPKSCVDDDALELILAHELLHCKYGDIWVRAATLAAWGVHWFNPLMFLMNREINRECEAACDQAVLRYMGTEKRARYGEMVLETAYRAAGGGNKPRDTVSLAFTNGSKQLKKRIASILEQKSMKSFTAVCCALALIGATLFSVLLTSYDVISKETIQIPEIIDAPVDLTPTDELIIYIPPWSSPWLLPAMERYRKLYPNVNLIDVDVSEDNGGFAYDTRITAELSEGKGPDVIFPSLAFFMDDYKAANSGAFLNLNEIIEQDKNFNTGDYVERVFNCGIYRGRQYIIPLSFSIFSYTSSAAKLNDIGFDLSKTGDTVSFIKEAVRALPKAEENPEFKYMFNEVRFLDSLFMASGIKLVDYETNKILPDEESLMKLLEAYKLYYYIDSDSSKRTALMSDYNETLKGGVYFFDNVLIDETIYSASALKSEGGYVISSMRRMDGKLQAVSYTTAAIRSGSKNQLNAWNFIKLLLAPEFQGVETRFNHPGMPVLKNAIDINIERVCNYLGVDLVEDKGKVLTQISQEEKQSYIDLVKSVDYCIGYSAHPIELLNEHMKPYFNNEKSYNECLEELKISLKLYIEEFDNFNQK